MTIKRIAAEKWGIKTNMLKILYEAVALPIIRYGSLLWYDVAKKSLMKRHLLALQRALILLVSRACRTTSTAAMQAIVGAKPMTLEIVEEALLKRVKRNLTTTWDSYEYREKGNEQFKQILKSEIEKVRAFITSKWQAQWESEAHGRETYRYIHDVTFAHNNRKWFRPNRYLTYLITGYGLINNTLRRRRLADTSACPMWRESEETSEHMIFECATYERVKFSRIESCKNSRKELISTSKCLQNPTNLQEKYFV